MTLSEANQRTRKTYTGMLKVPVKDNNTRGPFLSLFVQSLNWNHFWPNTVNTSIIQALSSLGSNLLQSMQATLLPRKGEI